MIQPKSIAAIFALTGFVVAAIAGLAGGCDAATALARALIAMPICFVVGLLAGWSVHHAIVEHVNAYRTENPIRPVQDYVMEVEGAPDRTSEKNT